MWNSCYTDNTLRSSCLKSIGGKDLKSLIINIEFKSWKSLYYCISCRHRLLGHVTYATIKQLWPPKTLKIYAILSPKNLENISNFEPQKPNQTLKPKILENISNFKSQKLWKYKQLWAPKTLKIEATLNRKNLKNISNFQPQKPNQLWGLKALKV